MSERKNFNASLTKSFKIRNPLIITLKKITRQITQITNKINYKFIQFFCRRTFKFLIFDSSSLLL